MKKINILLIVMLRAFIGIAQNIPVSSSTSPVITNLPGTITNVITPPAYGDVSANYVHVFTPQYPVSDAAAVDVSSSNAYLNFEVTYLNGDGKEVQHIRKYASQTRNLITPYDLRPSANKYSYLPYSSDLSTEMRDDAFSAQSSFYSDMYPSEENTAMSEVSYGSDDAKRYTWQMAPGKTNIGQKRGVRIVSSSNGAGEIIMWTLDANGKPLKTGYYPAGTLIKKMTETSDGAQVFEYYDNEGKLICKNMLADFHRCDISSDPSTPTTQTHAGNISALRTFIATNDKDDNSASSFDSAYKNDTAGLHPSTGSSGIITSGKGGVMRDEFNQDAIKEEPKLDERKMATNHFLFECPTYIMTYYVYDMYDRLVYTLYPKATEYLYQNAWIPTDDIINNLCDHIVYDARGRVVQKHQAGQNGDDLIVYDNHSRIAFRRRPGDDRWYWNHYDKYNRIIQTGDFQSAAARTVLQNYFDVGTAYSSSPLSIMYYLISEAQQGVYIDHTLTSPMPSDIYTYNFYDRYNYSSYFDGVSAQSISFSYDPDIYSGRMQGTIAANLPPEEPQGRTLGMLTYHISKVIKPYPISSLSDYLVSAFYYDNYGRVVQKQTVNAFGDLDKQGLQYDFKGRILTNIFDANNHTASDADDRHTTIVTHYNYNAYTMTLRSITESINGGIEREIDNFVYDKLGRLSVKYVGGIEYQKRTYNIRNMLTGINPLYAETGNDEGRQITFGESIKYDAGFTHNLYCGNIAGMIWRTKGESMRAYGYDYDRCGRLKQADFREYSDDGSGVSSWNNHSLDYTEGNITYDYNGNILSLKRYGPIPDASTGAIAPGVIDDLTYVYKTNDVSNQLQSVADNILPVTTNGVAYDFKDNNTTGTDYTYDNNGSMASDANKKVTGTSYYYFNKPRSRQFDNGNSMDFVYDAEGNKLQEIYTADGTPSVTDYNNNISYQYGLLHKIDNAEGYTTVTGTLQNYFFFVKDHLGNVRNVLNSYLSPVVFDYNATHEVSAAGRERLVFTNIENVTQDKPFTLDDLDIKAAELDAADTKTTIGTALVIKVMAGDRFDVAATSLYSSTDSSTGTITDDAVIASLINSFANNISSIGGADAHSMALLKGMESADNLKLLQALNANSPADPDRPQSFINYVLYDECFNIVPEVCGRIQIGAGADVWQSISTAAPISITRHGYLSVFLSTSTAHAGSWFDNLSIHHYVGNVQETHHYYPFGLSTGTVAAVMPIENHSLYQTKEHDKRENLYIEDFEARQYDPQLGRFLSLDAWNEFPSGYTGMGNNPVVFIDPTGNGAGSSTSTGTTQRNNVNNFEEGQSYTTELPEVIIVGKFSFNKYAYDTDWLSTFFSSSPFSWDWTNSDILSYATSKSQPFIIGDYRGGRSVSYLQKYAVKFGKATTLKKDYKILNIVNSFAYSVNTILGVNYAWEYVTQTNAWDGSTLSQEQINLAMLPPIMPAEGEIFNFSVKAAEHMEDPSRWVPNTFLQEAIQNGRKEIDKRGSDAIMHIIEMDRNGKTYTLEVLYHEGSNKIYHFKYYQ